MISTAYFSVSEGWIQHSPKKIRMGCTWRTAHSYFILVGEVDAPH